MLSFNGYYKASIQQLSAYLYFPLRDWTAQSSTAPVFPQEKMKPSIDFLIVIDGRQDLVLAFIFASHIIGT